MLYRNCSILGGLVSCPNYATKPLGAEVISINDKPDGLNINEHCGATSLDSLQTAVMVHEADLGIQVDLCVFAIDAYSTIAARFVYRFALQNALKYPLLQQR